MDGYGAYLTNITMPRKKKQGRTLLIWIPRSAFVAIDDDGRSEIAVVVDADKLGYPQGNIFCKLGKVAPDERDTESFDTIDGRTLLVTNRAVRTDSPVRF